VNEIHNMGAEIEKRFTYHRPTPDMTQTFVEIRDKAKEFAFLITRECPVGRETSLALTKLEEVVMWANAGLARSATAAQDTSS
jgi:hypothetical protein